MQRTQVAVAIITNQANQICISQRTCDQHLPDIWEFPGGKIEAGETPEMALKRELQEELDINVLSMHPIMQQPYDYPADDRYVMLHFYWVKQFTGTVVGKEGQPIRWVSVRQLEDYTFPKGNTVLLQQLSNLDLAGLV